MFFTVTHEEDSVTDGREFVTTYGNRKQAEAHQLKWGWKVAWTQQGKLVSKGRRVRVQDTGSVAVYIEDWLLAKFPAMQEAVLDNHIDQGVREFISTGKVTFNGEKVLN